MYLLCVFLQKKTLHVAHGSVSSHILMDWTPIKLVGSVSFPLQYNTVNS